MYNNLDLPYWSLSAALWLGFMLSLIIYLKMDGDFRYFIICTYADEQNIKALHQTIIDAI